MVGDVEVDSISLLLRYRLGLGDLRGGVGNVGFSISDSSFEDGKEVCWLVTSADEAMVEVTNVAIGIVPIRAKLKDTEDSSHNQASEYSRGVTTGRREILVEIHLFFVE